MTTVLPSDDWDWFDQRALGAGEFVTTGPNSTVAPATQNTFMRAIVHWAPEILEEAADAMLPSYTAILEEGNRKWDDGYFRIDDSLVDPYMHFHEGTVGGEFRMLYMPQEFWLTSGKTLYIDHYLEMRQEFEPAITELRTALGSWMAKYRLPYIWILKPLLFALGTIERRRDRGDCDSVIGAFESFFGSPGMVQGHPLLSEEMDLKIEIRQAYDPLFHDRQRSLNYSREETARQVEAFFDCIDSQMLGKGYVRSKKKRSPQHYLMVVDRHIRRHTWSQIKGTFGIDEHSAMDAVQELAKVMRLELIQGEPGRPKKKKQVQVL